MAKERVNVRLSTETKAFLMPLTMELDISQADVIVLAIRLLAEREGLR